jgi:hypothetical protein
MSDARIGLRAEDLDAADLLWLETALEGDEDAAADHAFALALEDVLDATFEEEGAPPAAAILARARQPSGGSWKGWAGGFLLAAAALVGGFVALDDDGLRARGVLGADATVQLDAVLDGPHPTAVGNGAEVRGGVVFFVKADGAGTVTLTEVGPRGRALIQRWTMDGPGRVPVGGDVPLAWQPEGAASGLHRYEVEWCDQGGTTCVQDELSLRWRSR